MIWDLPISPTAIPVCPSPQPKSQICIWSNRIFLLCLPAHTLFHLECCPCSGDPHTSLGTPVQHRLLSETSMSPFHLPCLPPESCLSLNHSEHMPRPNCRSPGIADWLTHTCPHRTVRSLGVRTECCVSSSPEHLARHLTHHTYGKTIWMSKSFISTDHPVCRHWGTYKLMFSAIYRFTQVDIFVRVCVWSLFSFAIWYK